MKLSDWFQYSDKNQHPYNPTSNTHINIDRYWEKQESDFNSPDWRKEEWLIHSALVPVDQLDNAANEFLSPDDLKFDIGWNFDNKFQFGDYSEHGDVQLYPLISSIMHPISKELTVELSREFLTYHALDKRNQSEYFHPLENILVCAVNIETHSFYDPTPNVVIHRDYLRDFLASINMGLLISVVADRFANALTQEALELEESEDRQIDEFTRLSSNVHSSESTDHGYFRGRSILRRNFIIRPYDTPKFERSPWYYFRDKSVEESEAPRFIVNDEGEKRILPKNTYLETYIQNGIGNFGYLYFRPEVLQKYLQVPGYSVFFHMRNWGIASLPGDRGNIDVGINSQGLVNAFAPDIANLSISEQSYWASYSSLPSGEVCEELFQTRMQCDPPNSPGVTNLIRNSCSSLDQVFEEKFSVNLFKDTQPSKQELCKLSIGPILNQDREIAELAKTLYEWVIERMEISSLRTAITVLGGIISEDEKKSLKQIGLLKKLLISKGLDETKAHLLTQPLAGLNTLRQGAAHTGSLKLESSFQKMGVSSVPQTPRDGWTFCVDATTQCLDTIMANFKT